MPAFNTQTIGGRIGLLEAAEASSTGLLSLDSDGRVVDANASAQALFHPLMMTGMTLIQVLEAASRHGLLTQADTRRLARWTTADANEPADLDTPSGGCFTVRKLEVPGEGGAIEFQDVTRRLQRAELSIRDPLTGLANRAAFHQRLDDAALRHQRTGETAAILCIDLDRFKAINDTLGHPMGDALLKSVSGRLQSVVRADDVVARLGGDEFAILQRGVTPQAVEALAARLVDLVGRAYAVSGHMLNIGASIGIAMLPSDGGDAEQLIRNADLALYRAKGDGRGLFRFFEPEMDAVMQARRSLEIDLRKALALKEFHLVFQPQVTAATGEIVGFETLLRWRHPDRGMVSPADFIPLAEEIGLIQPIGEWVLRQACREAAAWTQPVTIAVNVSAVQFRGGRLVSTVTSALANAGLEPSRLELEITEGALLDDTDAVLEALNQMRALGVRISMDDFGTGYSSLSYLQKFPFTKIKIDQSFVRQMGENPDCAAIVRAIAALGASLGMRTTAEGVETPEELAQVRAEGCTEVQGYLTGRPVGADLVEGLLARQLQSEEPHE